VKILGNTAVKCQASEMCPFPLQLRPEGSTASSSITWICFPG